MQRPFYPESGVCHVYLLHPPGGVAGGDRLDVAVRVGQGAHALITTPGATKFYRSSGPQARVRQRLSVAPGGILEWLPQEGIFFPGADIQVATELDLQGDARLFAWELQTLGRPALGERFSRGRADLGLALSRDGRPLLRERLRIEGTGGLDGPSTLRGFPICGTLIAGPATAEDLCWPGNWSAVRRGFRRRSPWWTGSWSHVVSPRLWSRCKGSIGPFGARCVRAC